VVVLPALAGNLDDQVYYVVKRTINGATVRYLEKWAQEIDCLGDQACATSPTPTWPTAAWPTTTISGLSHLEGEKSWCGPMARRRARRQRPPWTQRYTVAGGAITLADAASNVVVGLGYTAQFKSAKLGAHRPRASRR
jgi:hypothetical protein